MKNESNSTPQQSFEKLTETIAKLRDPIKGCPWDLQQTHHSLLKYLIEESFEYLYAVEQNDPQKMKEELGDVLLQVILHSQLASEKQQFNIQDVCQTINEKMITRHPHVFSQASRDLQDIEMNWEKLKNKEKKNYYNEEDLHTPSLICSQKIGEKAKKINFDWNSVKDVLVKVEEELEELKIELHKNDHEKIEEELGDLFFSLVQLSRHLKLDASETLRKANKKFIRRFTFIEDVLKKQKKSLFDTDQKTLEKLWLEAKTKKL